MSARKQILRQLMAFGLCAAIGFGVFNVGQAPLTPKASAATVYETKVTYGVNLRTSASTSGRVIRLIPTGEYIHVISKVNNYWLKVKDKRATPATYRQEIGTRRMAVPLLSARRATVS